MVRLATVNHPFLDKDTNPYVGPRAFGQKDTLYGRDRERIELADLLVSERVVVLHSPSGAGKTSLIQAGLLGELEKQRFRPLPPVRVNQLVPKTQPKAGRYAYSVMLSLESKLKALGSEANPSTLAEMTLRDYLGRVQESTRQGTDQSAYSAPLVLMIDQFEEILVLDPTDVGGRQQFFTELGDLLDDEPIWLLLAMREDFMGGLENFSHLMPTNLSMRFRLDLLGRDAATEAMQCPAFDQHKVRFSDTAAVRLLDNLCTILVQSPGRPPQPQVSPYVEGVILQTVLFNLWRELDPVRKRQKVIGPEHLGDLDHVDRALSQHFGTSVAAAAARSRVPERTVRDWFEYDLLTEQHWRNQADRGPGTEEKKAAKCLKALEAFHLVRSEPRLGRPWWELVHDRFINPVVNDNERWREQNDLVVLPVKAKLWSQSRRPELLLAAAEIPKADEWLKAHDRDAYDYEQEFVATSKDAAQAELDEGANLEGQFQVLSEYFRAFRIVRVWRMAAVLEAICIAALLAVIVVLM
jgi:hypothetical protein